MVRIDEFDFSNVEPAQTYERLPPGEYLVAVTGEEEKDTKAGDGKYLKLTFEVLEGRHKGRLHWEYLNLWNPNAQAVRIAVEKLAHLIAAAGKQGLKRTEELHRVPVIAVFAARKKAGGIGAQDVEVFLKTFKSAGSQPTPAVNTEDKAPWD